MKYEIKTMKLNRKIINQSKFSENRNVERFSDMYVKTY